MSGWHYRKQGLLNETTEGPLTDGRFLKMAYDGGLDLDTPVTHPQHTKGTWVTLANIPAAQKKLEAGETDRIQAKQIARDQAEQLKAGKKAAAAELKQQKIITMEVERQALVAADRARSAASAAQQPVNVAIVNESPERLESSGWFARAFSTTAGIMLAILLLSRP